MEQNKDIMQLIRALSKAVEAKDRYTNGHSERVAKYSKEIAKRLGWSDEDLEAIYNVGLLHDVGKIRIPGAIIRKKGKLDDEEYAYIKLHPNAGYHILKDIECIPHIGEGARYHHERYDGKGYPNGLVGKAIPEIARIIAVADAYDAMTSVRSYREVMPQEKVRGEIEGGKGKQFDPEIADIMLQIIDEDKNYELRQPDAKTMNILIIDDEKMNRKQVMHLLKDDESFNVIEADTGYEGVNRLYDNNVDLILLDIRMPDLDGFETLSMIRSVNTDVPVIFLTADKDIESINRAESLGVKDYLVKPVTKKALVDVIQNAM